MIATLRHHLLSMICLGFVAIVSITNSALAESTATPWVDRDTASIRLISAVQGVGNEKQSIKLGLEFKLEDGWKIYWRSPGDAGFPPIPDWSSSQNISDIVMDWPIPERFSVLGFETLGYKHAVVFPLNVTPTTTAQAVTLSGSIDYLICSDICIPDTVDLSLLVPQGPKTPSSHAHLINTYAVQVPGDGTAHGIDNIEIRTSKTNDGQDTLIITASDTLGTGFQSPDVFMEGPEELGYGKPEVINGNDKTRIELHVPVYNSEALTTPLAAATFTATLVDGARSAERTLNISTSKLESNDPIIISLLSMLGLAFLGGLILNLMPCVLPVLSIKLLSVLGHGGSDKHLIRQSFLASAAGIISSFVLIAAGLSALKLAGASVGWGIQFQHPWFLAIMIILVSAFACNLWGWFEFKLPRLFSDMASQQGPANTHSLSGHFLTGMLATLLATPCSAPFLGTAVGFALSHGSVETFAIFIFLGLGLSAPYLVIAFFPNLAAKLPKPGQWMITLRRILGFALLATAGWLLSVLSVQIGTQNALIVAVILVVMAIGLYVHHRSSGAINKASLIVTALCAAFAIILPITSVAPDRVQHVDKLWQPFDLARVHELTASGHIVLVDVTADWCLTCQVNKKLVLSGDPVLGLLETNKIIAMQADWTLPEPTITAYLASFQKYGIPFNAVYGPKAKGGIVLPEILTSQAVIDALNDAGMSTQ